MILVLSTAIATLFGCGAYLMLKHDLLRMAVGIILISNAANLFLISMALTLGVAPIYPLPQGLSVSDPVVQALVLTALVITFGVSAILLGLMYRVYLAHNSIDLDDLSRAEAEDERQSARQEEE